MLLGLSWEGAVLLICGLLLLPRIVGVLVNVVLVAVLQTPAERPRVHRGSVTASHH